MSGGGGGGGGELFMASKVISDIFYLDSQEMMHAQFFYFNVITLPE